MHDDEPNQFVDELLEASLKQYRGEEPRLGFEMRILAGVRTRQRVVRRRRLVWAMALCAGMLAAIGVALHLAHAPNREPVTSASGAHRAPLQAAKPSPIPSSADSRFGSPRLVPTPNQNSRTAKSAARAAKSAKPARPEQFPTPMPLTEQEKLLLIYLANTSKPDLLAETNHADVAMDIPSIKVAPLEIQPLAVSQSEQGK